MTESSVQPFSPPLLFVCSHANSEAEVSWNLIRDTRKRLPVTTTLAALGTAVDTTGQEIRIECYFPVDARTEEFCGKNLK